MLRRSLASVGVCILLAASAQASQEVIGKLGQTIEAAPIFAEPNLRGRVLYRAERFAYLVIRPTRFEPWLAVVMETGRLGFVRASKVARLPYDVSIDRTASSPSAAKGALAGYALTYVGTPYVWGGNDLRRGIDCSGFVQQLFGRIGVRLPRTAAQQALVGQPVTRLEDLRRGDRLFFWERRRNRIGHTGIYLGNGYFVHSSSGRDGVATDSLRDRKWRNTLVAARR
jgi:cell wall-associated NlpC family hydrolase